MRTIRPLLALTATLGLAACTNGPVTGLPQISTTPTSTTVTVPTTPSAQQVVSTIQADCGVIADAGAIASAILGFPPGTAIATMAKQFCALATKAPAGTRLGTASSGSVLFKGVVVPFARNGTADGAKLKAQNAR